MGDSMATTNKYDLAKLEDLASGFADKSITISPETMFLVIMALDDRAIYRGAWVDDGDAISDARWDEAIKLVEQAKKEIMT